MYRGSHLSIHVQSVDLDAADCHLVDAELDSNGGAGVGGWRATLQIDLRRMQGSKVTLMETEANIHRVQPKWNVISMI